MILATKLDSVCRRTLGVVLIFLGVLAACTVQAASDPIKECSSFPTMKKMKLQSVASQMDFNGVPMSIRRFESAEGMDAVLAFYRGRWAATATTQAAVEYVMGEWQVIGTLIDTCFYTVQVKNSSSGGSEGLLGLTVAKDGSTKSTVKEDVPMLPGSKVINDISHNDAGKTARTVLLKNGFSSPTNADFYRSSLGEKGWKVTNHHRGSNGDTRGDVLILRNGVREVSITVTQKGSESNVLLNYVDQP